MNAGQGTTPTADVAPDRAVGARPVGVGLYGLGLLGLWLLAIAARLWAGRDDDGLGGQDPWAYRDAARALAGWLHGTAPPPSGYFWPLGYPALGALLEPAAGEAGRALRWASIGFGGAAAPLTAALASRCGQRARAAVVAGAVVALGAAAVVAGAAVMADAVTVTWLAAGALALTMVAPPSSRRAALAWALAAGLCLGVAFVTRRAAAVAAPAALVYAWTWRRPGERWRWLALALGLALPIALQRWVDPHPAGGLDHTWLQRWQPANALQRAFDTPDGHGSYAFPQAVFAAFPLLHPGYLAPPGLLFAIVGARALDRRARPLAAALLGWFGLNFALLAGMPYQNFRFGLMALVPVAVAFGVGVDAALRWASSQSAQRRAGVLGALALCALWTAAWTPRMVGRHLDARAARRATIAAVAAEVRQLAADLAPAGAPARSPRCVVFELSADLANREGLDVLDLSLVDAGARAALAAEAERRPLVLVVDDGDLRGQWRGSAVAARLAALEAAFAVGPGRRVGAYRVAHLEPRR
jgi:hypothetical protein